MQNLNKNIKFVEKDIKIHSKASEKYVHVKFTYPNSTWDGWIPIEYRRTGISIKTKEELIDYLNNVYEQMNPDNFNKWMEEQQKFWDEEKPKALTTKTFFDTLAQGGWKCVECDFPKNPNWARRIQDLKEFGYTLATDTKRYCKKCGENKTHLIMLPINRGNIGGNGYETWSPTLRKRIIKLLNSIDVYENVYSPHCLPDHKFSEIRWDKSTKSKNPDTMTDEEIVEKFQLLTNQRNQQKREVCRMCFQTGKRGTIYGIKYYYIGDENWDNSIPKTGKDAERGCFGCPWYDIAKWRIEVLKKLLGK